MKINFEKITLNRLQIVNIQSDLFRGNRETETWSSRRITSKDDALPPRKDCNICCTVATHNRNLQRPTERTRKKALEPHPFEKTTRDLNFRHIFAWNWMLVERSRLRGSIARSNRDQPHSMRAWKFKIQITKSMKRAGPQSMVRKRWHREGGGWREATERSGGRCGQSGHRRWSLGRGGLDRHNRHFVKYGRTKLWNCMI